MCARRRTLDRSVINRRWRVALAVVIVTSLPTSYAAARQRLNIRSGAAAHPLVNHPRHYVMPEWLGPSHFLLPGVMPPLLLHGPEASGTAGGGGSAGSGANSSSGGAAAGGGTPVEAADAGALHGNLHVFLRGVSNATHLLLRGFLYHDNVTEPQLSNNQKLITPVRLTRWAVSLSATRPGGDEGDVSTGVDDEALQLEVQLAADFCKPVAISGALPLERAGEYTLVVDRLHRVAPLGAVAAAATEQVQPEPGQQAPETEVYSVIASWVPPQLHSLGVALLRTHVEYHRRLGLTSTIAYLRPAVLAALAGDQGVDAAVRGQQLVLVAWDYLPHVAGAPSYDQAVAYNHALLALWQRGAWAFLSDVDSLLALPGGPASVAQLLAPGGCLAGHQNKLKAYHTVCNDCYNSDVPEESHWKLEDSRGYGLAPLLRYTLRAKALAGVRSLVDPDHVAQFFLFDGNVIDPSSDVTVVANESSCAYVASLRPLVEGQAGIAGGGSGASGGGSSGGGSGGDGAAGGTQVIAIPPYDLVEAATWLWAANSSSTASTSGSTDAGSSAGDSIGGASPADNVTATQMD